MHLQEVFSDICMSLKAQSSSGRYVPTDKATAMAAEAGKLVVRLHLLPDSTTTANHCIALHCIALHCVQVVPLSKADFILFTKDLFKVCTIAQDKSFMHDASVKTLFPLYYPLRPLGSASPFK